MKHAGTNLNSFLTREMLELRHTRRYLLIIEVSLDSALLQIVTMGKRTWSISRIYLTRTVGLGQKMALTIYTK